MDRLKELTFNGAKGLDAGCGSGARDVTLPELCRVLKPGGGSQVFRLVTRQFKKLEVVIGFLYKETIGTGKGFINRLERITIGDAGTSPNIPASVIIKLPSGDPSLISLIEKLGKREREVRFYREIAGQANIHPSGIYFSDIDKLTGDPVLVMEDMGNYHQGDSVEDCSLDDAKSAIRELGNFHSHWWENERLDSLDWIPLKDSEADMYREIYPEARRIVLEKSGDNIADDLKTMGAKLAGKVSYIKGK